MKFPHASNSFKKLNPHYFGMGEFQPQIAKQKAERALDGKPQGCQTRGVGLAGNRPQLRITIVNFRRRQLDDDNLTGGFKPLRDSIARWLGMDDSQRFIEWEYGQCKTSGKEGTAIRIERI